MRRTHEARPGSWLAVALLVSLLAASCARKDERGAEAGYDPLARSREAAGRVEKPRGLGAAALLHDVHRTITNGSTDLGKANRIYTDGRLRLEW